MLPVLTSSRTSPPLQGMVLAGSLMGVSGDANAEYAAGLYVGADLSAKAVCQVR